MKSKKLLATVVILLCLSLGLAEARAQSDEVPKFEVGAQFTSITKPSADNGDTEPGLGGRFTLNLNRSVALEAMGNFFPHSCRFCGDNSGNITQGLVGVKAGKRFDKWGIFAKVRPGVVSFSQGDNKFVSTGAGSSFPIQFEQKRLNNFALDLGGVLEFYPSRHIVTRFEAGDTMIHYGSRPSNLLLFDPTSGAPLLIPFRTQADTRHNFQFAAGVGWRF
jgi:hypothetical protein